MNLLGLALLVISSQLNAGHSFSLPGSNKAGCAINLDTSSPTFPPHLIDENKKIVLPVIEGTARIINLNEGQQVTVSCLGVGNLLNATGLQLNPATCAASSNLQFADGTEFSYDELTCLIQNHEVLVEQGTCANGPGTFIRNGWEFGADFIPLFDMCHDETLALNYYAIDTVYGRSANADDKTNDRPYYFSQDVYFPGISVNTQYTQVEQTKTIAMIVGSADLAAQYIVPNTEYYFARGHLAPDADFIDAASQDASYYFMNTAPQFQIFNNGNWKWLEIGVRNTALARQLDLTIYTGTFSVTTLADINGVQQPIYLAFDENSNGLIPAPKYYWKLIHEPISNTATAVIGINNPYNPVMPEDILCPDVCDQIPWVNDAIFQLTNIAKGYTFCCTAAELHKAISFAPNLDVPLFV